MPLVIVCGPPCSRKSEVSGRLSEYLRSRGCVTHVVSDESVGVRCRAEGYGSEECEQHLRSLLKAEVERTVSQGITVIVDSLNYIRGYRYELFCLAKARSTPSCTVWCRAAGPQGAERRNLDSVGDASTPRYPVELLRDLFSRFEAPRTTNRWERQLFTVDSDAGESAVQDSVLESVRGAIFGSGVATSPNDSTLETKSASAKAVQNLDGAAAEVASEVLRGVNDPSWAPGDRVPVISGSRTVMVPRRLGAAELGRLRRQFVRISEAHASDISNAQDSFVSFLQSSLL